MSTEAYQFGPYTIDAKEVFCSTNLSFAMVNLRPVVPGTFFYLFLSLIAPGCFFLCIDLLRWLNSSSSLQVISFLTDLVLILNCIQWNLMIVILFFNKSSNYEFDDCCSIESAYLKCMC